MNIQSVDGFSYSNACVQTSKNCNNKKTSNRSNDTYKKNMNFGNNYSKTFQTLSVSDLKHSSKVISMFNNLLDSIKQEPNIKITSEGQFILNELKENGLVNTLVNLSQKEPMEKYKQLILDSQENNISLIKSGNKELFGLYNLGPSKLINTFSDILSVPRNMELSFSDFSGKKHSFWGLSYPKDLEMILADDKSSTYIKYYGTDGGKQKVVEQLYGGNPEATYYNRDGSKSFFKNWFFGGSSTPAY